MLGLSAGKRALLRHYKGSARRSLEVEVRVCDKFLKRNL